jgi:hypothetical protein
MKETKENQGRRGAVIVTGFVWIAMLASSALLVKGYSQSASQKPSADPIGVNSKQLGIVSSSGPSRSKVTLELTFDTGAVFRVSQYEGSLIRVERNGSTVGMIPHVDTRNGNQVTATILEGAPLNMRDVSLLERIAKTGSIELGRESSDLATGGLRVKVAIVAIVYEVSNTGETTKNSRLRLQSDPGGLGDGPECCVTCDGIKVCGCAVDAPCGSCCVSTCCG